MLHRCQEMTGFRLPPRASCLSGHRRHDKPIWRTTGKATISAACRSCRKRGQDADDSFATERARERMFIPCHGSRAGRRCHGRPYLWTVDVDVEEVHGRGYTWALSGRKAVLPTRRSTVCQPAWIHLCMPGLAR